MLAMLAIDDFLRRTLLGGVFTPSSNATLFRALLTLFAVFASVFAGVQLLRHGVGSTVTSLRRAFPSGRTVTSLSLVAALFGVKQKEERSVKPDGE
jgi:hypothetical protein